MTANPPLSQIPALVKAWKAWFLLSVFAGLLVTSDATQLSLSQEWLFHKGDVEGGERPDFVDRDWRQLTVPHDFSIEDRSDGAPPFDEETPTGSASGYIPGGTAWYRRHLMLSADDAAGVVLRVSKQCIWTPISG
jgi:beta-galactosidase